VQAVAAWRFEVPTIGGKTVVVRVKAPFAFKAPASPPAPSKQAPSSSP